MATKLNASLWMQDMKLQQNIREMLIQLAEDFTEFVKIKNLKIVDIILTGSLANYNWHEKSDVDLHIIYDLSNFERHRNFVSEYLQTKKSVWSYEHKIYVHKFLVEIYPEDFQQIRQSMGVYSVLKNSWIQKPELKSVSVNKELVRQKYQNKVDEILYIEELSQKDGVNYKKVIKDIEAFVIKLRDWRDIGLKENGEYSPENLVFKLLRNAGYIKKLSDLKKCLYDKYMTIKEKVIKKHAT